MKIKQATFEASDLVKVDLETENEQRTIEHISRYRSYIVDFETHPDKYATAEGKEFKDAIRRNLVTAERRLKQLALS